MTADSDRTPVGRGPQDIHDFYLEMLKFYTSFQSPPADVSGYRDPFNLRPVVNFEQELDEMARNLSAETSVSEEAKQIGNSLMNGVRQRQIQSFADFQADFSRYQEALKRNTLDSGNMAPARQAWQQALDLLREDHWTKYLFDAEAELALLECA